MPSRLLLSLIFLPTVVISAVVFAQEVSLEIPEGNIGEISAERQEPASVMFVGDIMLGRRVETMMRKSGADYPFREVEELLQTPDLTVGNFEGVVNEKHVHTPDLTFRFSVRKEYLEELEDRGFDILSLANNHSLDYGEDSLQYTRELCTLYKMTCGGTPQTLDEHSLFIKEVGGHSIGFIFLSTVGGEPDPATLALFTDALSSESTFQIAYIHWGDEYKLRHNRAQERLAKRLIDQGIDLVVGHHPHVVQDVELYHDKLIFYSLGNFIFDQYFSKDVQEGLALNLTLDGASQKYSLTAFSSAKSRSQPDPMAGEESKKLFARILKSLPDEMLIDKETGRIHLPL